MCSQGYVEASLADLKCSQIYLTLSLGLESNDFSRICSNPQVAQTSCLVFTDQPQAACSSYRGSGTLNDTLNTLVPVLRPRTQSWDLCSLVSQEGNHDGRQSSSV